MGMLDGKRALITGARKGIGRGIAMKLAQEGAHVGINDIVADRVTERTLRFIESQGGRATIHRGDVSTVGEVFRVVDEFVAAHGGIDILVNNAIVTQQSRSFFETDEAFWDQMMAVSLKGYFFASQRAAQAMVRQGTGGSIVCISSVHAFDGRPHWTTYGTAKAGLQRMVKGLAADLAGTGIRTNCIAPGPIRNALPEILDDTDPTPFAWNGPGIRDVPLKHGGQPSDIANAVLYLCSDMGRFVNGETIMVDGGLEAVRLS